MELSLLKAVLDQLNLDPRIDTLKDRKLMQKAVYLAQRAGADMGYRFGWYIKGPYSTSLADHYYRLDKNPEPKPELRLSTESQEMLEPIRDLLVVPAGVPLAQPEWAELVASIDYLRTVSRQPQAEASQTLRIQKPHLADYEPQALTALERAGLL